ncbi:MAG: hypothetical protein RBS49_06745 [Sphaerochaeta sp.]|jgi:hypothetical protein|nr:hypothetical protein [Sphaerochaeta sp.]
MYLELEAMAKAPGTVNHYSVQFLFTKEAGYIKNVGTYFGSKRTLLYAVSDQLFEGFKELILDARNERVLLIEGTKGSQCPQFNRQVQEIVFHAYDAIVKQSNKTT